MKITTTLNSFGLCLALALPILTVWSQSHANEVAAPAPLTRELERTGTQFRLHGDFAGSDEIQRQLLEIDTDPVGHIYALNTIVTHMTWDETQSEYEQALVHHAEQTLQWCHNKQNLKRDPARAHYYCGQAHFALSYFHGLQGNYYQAGRNGTECIEHLELALVAAPELIDAKMHLGVAYYIADNLPPFIKMFARLLWFIPSGNSEKSLPYLRDVIENGDQFVDVARYSYINLLLEEPDLVPEAVMQLRTLTANYPGNKRFHLRLISALMIQAAFTDALDAINIYLTQFPEAEALDLSLAQIWQVRAYLGEGELELARDVFAEVDPIVTAAASELPTWSLAWHQLNRGQMHDLQEQRTLAVRVYKEILDAAKTSYVSDVIQEAARAGLANPYRMDNH